MDIKETYRALRNEVEKMEQALPKEEANAATRSGHSYASAQLSGAQLCAWGELTLIEYGAWLYLKRAFRGRFNVGT
jgi:hypothetical protein